MPPTSEEHVIQKARTGWKELQGLKIAVSNGQDVLHSLLKDAGTIYPVDVTNFQGRIHCKTEAYAECILGNKMADCMQGFDCEDLL